MENLLCIFGIHLHSKVVSEVFENDTAIVSRKTIESRICENSDVMLIIEC